MRVFHVKRRVVLWGARKGDIQLGSRQDRRREAILRQNAAFARLAVTMKGITDAAVSAAQIMASSITTAMLDASAVTTRRLS